MIVDCMINGINGINACGANSATMHIYYSESPIQ